MKNNIKLGVFAFLSILLMIACEPQDSSDYSLGAKPTADQLDFDVTPTASKANVIDFKNTSKIKGVATWDLVRWGDTSILSENLPAYSSNRTWKDYCKYLPIPQSEIEKTDGEFLLKQNTGY